ncbi:hypothetical protein F4775DRAFT_450025 [Biscogniauxia sp. FL1348]|nr:hypothetical protein F4775DRAFT_450025 [Biscogniauxia sp. FL1348]
MTLNLLFIFILFLFLFYFHATYLLLHIHMLNQSHYYITISIPFIILMIQVPLLLMRSFMLRTYLNHLPSRLITMHIFSFHGLTEEQNQNSHNPQRGKKNPQEESITDRESEFKHGNILSIVRDRYSQLRLPNAIPPSRFLGVFTKDKSGRLVSTHVINGRDRYPDRLKKLIKRHV